MATYPIPSLIARLEAAGGTVAELLAELEPVQAVTTRWVNGAQEVHAWSRSGEAQVIAYVERVEMRAPRGPVLATDRQVQYARQLGATDEQVAGLTKTDASVLIDSLKARAAGRRHGINGEIWDA